MKKLIYIVLVALFVAGCNNKSRNEKEIIKEPVIVSKITTNEAGKTYLEVDGKPMLYKAVQAWLPSNGDFELYMSKAQEAGYEIFIFWFPWRYIEPVQSKYDWTFLNEIISQAEKYNMRLDIIWGGSNFCGGLDPRFAPDFIFNNQEYHKLNDYGKPIEVRKYDMGLCNVADHSNKKLLAIESATVQAMMNYIHKRDTSHRVIFFQVENEPDLKEWAKQDKKDVLEYCNQIGKVVKTSPYSVATRMNLASWEYEPLIDSLEFIDCHGLDLYTDEIDVTIKASTANAKMPHVAENAAYANSSSLIAEAIANGGFYNIYRLDYDYVWDNPGVYGENWIYVPQTFDIRLLNTGLNKISSQVAESSAENMLCFNTETKNPVKSYYKIKELKDFDIGFKSPSIRDGEAVGFVLFYNNSCFLIADKRCSFDFSEKVMAETGYFNENDEWISERTKSLTLNDKGRFELQYDFYDCIKINKLQ